MYIMPGYDMRDAQEPLVTSIFRAADFNVVGHDKVAEASRISKFLCGVLDPVAEHRLTAEAITADDFEWLRFEPRQALPKCPVPL